MATRVQDLLRHVSALPPRDVDCVIALVQSDPTFERALDQLARQARMFDDEGPTRLRHLMFDDEVPTHLQALFFGTRRREWTVIRGDETSPWLLMPAHPRGSGPISHLPPREKLQPIYDQIQKNAKELRGHKATPARDSTIAFTRFLSQTLEVMRQNGVVVGAMNRRSLAITFAEFLKDEWSPSEFARRCLAALLPGEPSAETVRAHLARKS